MNNILRVTLIIISSVLLVFFCYKLYLNLTLIEKPGFYDFERSNIQEKIVGDKKILTEKNLGVKMEIPKDWEYEKSEQTIIFGTPGLDIKDILKNFNEWKQGCLVGFSVSNDYVQKFENGEVLSTYDDESNRIKYFKEGDEDYCDFDYCEVINMNGIEGLEQTREFSHGTLEGGKYKYITLLDDKNRRFYTIDTYLSEQIPECQEHLNNFVNSLEFK